MLRHLIWTALLGVLLAGCATTGPSDDAMGGKAPLAEKASSYTTTQAVYGEGTLIGYILVYEQVPITADEPQYTAPGTIFIKDLDFNNVGFISPAGTLYRFCEGNQPEREAHQTSLIKNLAVFHKRPAGSIAVKDVVAAPETAAPARTIPEEETEEPEETSEEEEEEPEEE